MGVPVVTMAGDSHASRVGASILSRVGFGRLAVATDTEDYVRAAVAWSQDLGYLANLRGGGQAGLRAKTRSGPLGDGARIARQMEEAFASTVTSPRARNWL
jgi:protein O-GlcNAc transferase